MGKDISLFLVLGLGLPSGTLLIDRLLVNVPDWVAIIVSIVAIASLVYHILFHLNKNK